MQFELAPIYEDANIANDHNALTMDVARKVALRHHLVCLFHEKPFEGLNGSGKHSNWSLVTDRGENLLDPGRTPHQNLRFLAFLAVCLKAVHDHGDAMRASIATANNDLRLGANEAPPAILSVFVGDYLTQIIERILGGAPGRRHRAVHRGHGRGPAAAARARLHRPQPHLAVRLHRQPLRVPGRGLVHELRRADGRAAGRGGRRHHAARRTAEEQARRRGTPR
jgi:L-glutamine synthetase (EC 6.3.1.2)